MEHALVIGASGGIGRAVAEEWRTRGAVVRGLSRATDGLDITDPASVARVMGALDGPYDAVFVAIGILAPPGSAPEKQLAQIDPAAMARVFAVNTIGVATILTHLPRLLPRKGRSVTGVLTAKVGSIGDNRLGGWYSYRASKAALNQIVHGAAIEIARSHREAVIAALHPGTVATPFTQGYDPAYGKTTPEQAARALCDVMAGLAPAQTGGFFDYAGHNLPW